MTTPWSNLEDNGGRCESCDRPESKHEGQVAMPIIMTDGNGGTVHGTMWVCATCATRKHRERVVKFVTAFLEACGLT